MCCRMLSPREACQQCRESRQSTNCYELTVACMSGSREPPETSLTRCAPAATASLATAALKVSTEMGTPWRALSWASALQHQPQPGMAGPAPLHHPQLGGHCTGRLHMHTSIC